MLLLSPVQVRDAEVRCGICCTSGHTAQFVSLHLVLLVPHVRLGIVQAG